MNYLLMASKATSGAQSTGGMLFGIVGYMVIIIGAFYFIAIRPQKKQQKKHDALLITLAAGDSVLTTSGFYGVAIDVTDDIVIVEFGNNKNCRIPVQKAAIVEIEKEKEEE